MTVKELIDILQSYSPDDEVLLHSDKDDSMYCDLFISFVPVTQTVVIERM